MHACVWVENPKQIEGLLKQKLAPYKQRDGGDESFDIEYLEAFTALYELKPHYALSEEPQLALYEDIVIPPAPKFPMPYQEIREVFLQFLPDRDNDPDWEPNDEAEKFLEQEYCGALRSPDLYRLGRNFLRSEHFKRWRQERLQGWRDYQI